MRTIHRSCFLASVSVCWRCICCSRLQWVGDFVTLCINSLQICTQRGIRCTFKKWFCSDSQNGVQHKLLILSKPLETSRTSHGNVIPSRESREWPMRHGGRRWQNGSYSCNAPPWRHLRPMRLARVRGIACDPLNGGMRLWLRYGMHRGDVTKDTSNDDSVSFHRDMPKHYIVFLTRVQDTYNINATRCRTSV